MKVIGRLLGEASCLAVVLAVLGQASAGWRGLRFTPDTTLHLGDIRAAPTDQRHPTTPTASLGGLTSLVDHPNHPARDNVAGHHI